MLLKLMEHDCGNTNPNFLDLGGSFPPLTFSDVRVAKITNNYFVSDTQLLIFAPLSAITDVEIRLSSFIKSGS